MQEKIKTKIGDAWIEGDVVMVEIWGKIDEGSAREFMKEIIEWTRKGNFRECVIIDVSGLEKVALGARRVFVLGYKEKTLKRVALVCKNPLSRIIASFFLGVDRPQIPTKMFDSVEDAKKWCKQK
jgi:hypothetical protein